jgi:hypothetical protein
MSSSLALEPPKGVVASSIAAQGTRSKELLDWLEGSSGPGLAAADEVLQVLIPKSAKTAPQPVAFVMMGRMGDLTPSELEAIVELLRQKTGDASISLAFSRAGSIKLILNGSPEGLARLREMFEVGELERLDIPPVEAVTPIESNSKDARKARLIQVFRLRWRSSIIDSARARDLARALDLASNLASDLDRNRNRDRVLASLADDLDRVLDRASDLASDRDRVLDLSGADLRDVPLNKVPGVLIAVGCIRAAMHH